MKFDKVCEFRRLENLVTESWIILLGQFYRKNMKEVTHDIWWKFEVFWTIFETCVWLWKRLDASIFFAWILRFPNFCCCQQIYFSQVLIIPSLQIFCNHSSDIYFYMVYCISFPTFLWFSVTLYCQGSLKN